MVEITKGNFAPQPFDARVNQSAMSAKVKSGVDAVSDVYLKIGEEVTQQGNAFMKEAETSIKGAEKARMVAAAHKLYSQRRQERLDKIVDTESGQPTYKTLPIDMQRIGEDTASEIMNMTTDPDVRMAFKQEFYQFLGNDLIKVGQVQRQQVMQHGQASMKMSLDALTEQAILDDADNQGIYSAQAREIIDEQYAGGNISPIQRVELFKQFEEATRTGHLRMFIDKDPASAMETFENNGPAELGIPHTKYLQLKREAKAAYNAAMRVSREQARQLEKEAMFKAMSNHILVDGDPHVFTDKERDDHFDYIKDSTEGDLGREMTLTEQVKLASNYNALVPSLKKSLDYAITNGSEEQGAEALQGLLQLRASGKGVVTGNLSKNAEAIIARSKVAMMASSEDAATVIRNAREVILKTDPYKMEQLQNDKKDSGLFKDRDSREDTARKVLGPMIKEGHVLFWKNDVAPGTLERVNRMVETNWVAVSGDDDAAVEMTKGQVGNSFGLNTVGGKQEVMYLPPNKMFPGVSEDLLNTNLKTSLMGLNIELPPGVSIDDIFVRSDSITEAEARTNPSYGLYYPDAAGNAVALTDASGYLRWNINPASMKAATNKINDVKMELEADILRKEAERQAKKEEWIAKHSTRSGISAVVTTPLFIDEPRKPGPNPMNQRENARRPSGLPAGIKTLEDVYGTEMYSYPSFIMRLADTYGIENMARMNAIAKDLYESEEYGGEDRFREGGASYVMKLVSAVMDGIDPMAKTSNGAFTAPPAVLGTVSTRFESGMDPRTVVRSDPNGGSYGMFKFNGTTLEKFLEVSGNHADFAGLTPGTPDFIAKWNEFSGKPEFNQAQHDYAIEALFKPLRYMADKEGVYKGAAVDEALFSIAIQHDKKFQKKVIDRAMEFKPSTEGDWVTALYRARSELYPKDQKRYGKERAAVLRRYGG